MPVSLGCSNAQAADGGRARHCVRARRYRQVCHARGAWTTRRSILEFDDGDVTLLIGGHAGLGEWRRGVPRRRERPGADRRCRIAAPAGSLRAIADQCRATEDDEEQNGLSWRTCDCRRITPVSALPGTCIVAFIDYEEALAPAAALRRSLITAGPGVHPDGRAALADRGAVTSRRPVRRLAATARALQAGDFSQRVPVDGPSEVQGLGRAVAAMASDLAELLSQEQSRPPGGRGGEPIERPVPGNALARAADAADGGTRLGAHAAHRSRTTRSGSSAPQRRSSAAPNRSAGSSRTCSTSPASPPGACA